MKQTRNKYWILTLDQVLKRGEFLIKCKDIFQELISITMNPTHLFELKLSITNLDTKDILFKILNLRFSNNISVSWAFWQALDHKS